MDTDDLTPTAYDCLLLANHVTGVLMTELGATCSRYKTENEYLHGILADVKEIEEDPTDYLDYWNLLDEIATPVFVQRLRKLRKHIERAIATPVKDRGKPPFEEA